MATLGEMQRTITIYDPDSRTVQAAEETITGTRPPLIPKNWWPWIIAAAALGGMWYLTREEEERTPKAEAG